MWLSIATSRAFVSVDTISKQKLILTRAHASTLPFTYVPPLMVVDTVFTTGAGTAQFITCTCISLITVPINTPFLYSFILVVSVAAPVSVGLKDICPVVVSSTNELFVCIGLVVVL